MGKMFLLTEETVKKLEVLLVQGPVAFDSTDFRVVERAEGKYVQLVESNELGRGFSRKKMPFEVTLGRTTGETPTYFVTVAHGKVIERDMTKGEDVDALPGYVCTNRLDGADPRKFTIAVGQSIFVVIAENTQGAIDSTVDIVLTVADTATTKSLNYIPDVQDGIYYYKLASLEADGDGVKLVDEIAGSHIFHSTGLTADLVLRDCPIIEEGSPLPGVQLWRASFVSGKLAAVGQSEEERAYAPTVEETNVSYCT